MCHCQPWEDSPPQSEDFPQRTGNGVEHLQVRWETGMATLEEQITSVEARVEKLKATMLQLRREMLIRLHAKMEVQKSFEGLELLLDLATWKSILNPSMHWIAVSKWFGQYYESINVEKKEGFGDKATH